MNNFATPFAIIAVIFDEFVGVVSLIILARSHIAGVAWNCFMHGLFGILISHGLFVLFCAITNGVINSGNSAIRKSRLFISC
jgi:hypothetical protein